MTGRVCFDGVIDSWYHGYGISRYYRSLARGAGACGWDVRLFDYGSDVSEFNGLRGVSVDSVVPRFLERYRDFQGAVDGFDVFHSSYYRIPASDARGGVKRVVTTVHDFVYERFAPPIRRAVHSFQKRRAVANSDLVICISESTKKDLLSFFPEAESKRICVVYNGISDAFFRTSGGLSPSDNEFALFVGGRGGYKNFRFAVEALAKVPGVDLVIVGGGELSTQEIFLLDTCLPGRYLHAGRVDDSVLRDYYSLALCLIYSSLYEGFGMPVLEAMRCGCPVVAVDSPAIAEVSCGHALLAFPNDLAGMAENIASCRSVSLRDQLAVSGMAHASSYTWDRCVERTLDAYFS